MKRINRFRLVPIVGVICALLLSTTAAPAAGTPGPATSARVAAYLAAHPGGKPISDNEISYHDGVVIVTVEADVGIRGVADCPRGWFCFYDRPSFGYPRGKLSSCGRQNLATWGWQFRTESVHYNMSSGYVVFLYYDTGLFYASPANRVLTDVAPYRNYANYVHRYC